MAKTKSRKKVANRTFQERLKSLGFSSYRNYLRCGHWSKVKAACREMEIYQHCIACGASGQLHRHHLRYNRLGEEWYCDLVPVCDECHKQIHLSVKAKLFGLADIEEQLVRLFAVPPAIARKRAQIFAAMQWAIVPDKGTPRKKSASSKATQEKQAAKRERRLSKRPVCSQCKAHRKRVDAEGVCQPCRQIAASKKITCTHCSQNAKKLADGLCDSCQRLIAHYASRGVTMKVNKRGLKQTTKESLAERRARVQLEKERDAKRESKIGSTPSQAIPRNGSGLRDWIKNRARVGKS